MGTPAFSFKSVTSTLIAASKSSATKSVAVAIFTNPITLTVFGIIIAVVLLIVIVTSVIPIPSFFNSESADIGEVFHVGVEWLLHGDEEKKYFPLNEQMAQWLWNHPEIREQIWKMMEDRKNV